MKNYLRFCVQTLRDSPDLWTKKQRYFFLSKFLQGSLHTRSSKGNLVLEVYIKPLRFSQSNKQMNLNLQGSVLVLLERNNKKPIKLLYSLQRKASLKIKGVTSPACPSPTHQRAPSSEYWTHPGHVELISYITKYIKRAHANLKHKVLLASQHTRLFAALPLFHCFDSSLCFLDSHSFYLFSVFLDYCLLLRLLNCVWILFLLSLWRCQKNSQLSRDLTIETLREKESLSHKEKLRNP